MRETFDKQTQNLRQSADRQLLRGVDLAFARFAFVLVVVRQLVGGAKYM